MVLPLWARLVSAALGAGELAAGGAAVFVTDSEAGPVALLVLGTMSLIVAASGRLPSRLKFGDNEVEMAAAEEIVADLASVVSDTDRAMLISRLNGLSIAAPEVSAAGFRALGYETLVGDLLRTAAAANRRQITFRHQSDQSEPILWDALLEPGGAVPLAIQIIGTRRVNYSRISEDITTFANFLKGRSANDSHDAQWRLLIIGRSETPSNFQQLRDQQHFDEYTVRYLRIEDDEDYPQLLEMISRMPNARYGTD